MAVAHLARLRSLDPRLGAARKSATCSAAKPRRFDITVVSVSVTNATGPSDETPEKAGRATPRRLYRHLDGGEIRRLISRTSVCPHCGQRKSRRT
jgi:hypothetical protein